jgi:hypothetical protein
MASAAHNASCLRWNKRNPDKVKLYQKRHRSTEEYKANRRIKRQAAYSLDGSKEKADQKIYRLSLRDKVIEAYGKVCACCGEDNKGFLTIDHVDGMILEMTIVGRKLGNWQLYLYLIKSNFPSGYQLLCANCNLAIGWWGVCPHKREAY